MIKIINLIGSFFSKINLQNKKEILFDVSDVEIISFNNGCSWKYRGTATLRDKPESKCHFMVDIKSKNPFLHPSKPEKAKAKKQAEKQVRLHYLHKAREQ